MAFTITSGEEYFPVPTISRERKVLPAITRGSWLVKESTSHKVDDFQFVAFLQEGVFVTFPGNYFKVSFHRHPGGVKPKISK